MASQTTDDLVQGSITPSRAVNTTAPLAGGGALSSDLTLTLTTSPASQTPVGVTRSIATTAPITGGGDLSADRTIAISDFVGDSGAGGVKGAVPAPGAGDAAASKYLDADGTWSVPPEQTTGTHGEFTAVSYQTEEITLATDAAFTDSTGDLLPANAEILGVVARVTTTITTATDWKLGDPTTAGRFTAANSTLVAGTTDIGLLHRAGGISTDATGAIQATAAKLRISTTGTPGAGAVRVTVFYRRFSAPSS